ncbi:MAG: hypothetical protein COV70_00355 [Parcubacteria group bacterium CG11_big_fil_rev_8_21_14_0_20_39_22]|nr:MAG: hypothetical protein COV70_00355 [Parcubacteria group bacterium CG11_big_fil_rev_8_21_14_0_20_39_22]
MIITYHGVQCFKVSFGDTVIAFDPISKDAKEKSSRFGADIALVSVNDPRTNGTDQVVSSGKEPFVITGPGEYEIKEIFITGVPSVTKFGSEGEEKINTIYNVTLEGMNIVFLGALSSTELESKTIETVTDGDIDILFVPVGESEVLGPKDAYKMAVKLGPKIIIPMYDREGGKESLKTFLKEGGAESVKPVDKLTLKRKDIEGKDGDIVVLSPQS